LRFILLCAGFTAFMASGQTVHASDTCQRYTGGKCKAGQQMPPGLKSGATSRQQAQPPARGNHKGRDAYTPAQREAYMEEARQLCRRKFGAPSRVYRIDYRKNLIWCEPPSY
jgi:hypothetical protein